MNTKILVSLSIIGVVAAVAVGGTIAYFSDTETSTGNTFTAGTIDIAVNGQNPWSEIGQYQFVDMKPSQVEYSNFIINNVGTNPVNVWKKVDVGVTSGGITSEPECMENNGTWNNNACGGNYVENSAIDTAITYDLSVKLKNLSQVVVWEQTLYNMNKTIRDITGQGTFLGMIPKGWSMDVVESYHMLDNTTNWAQGDVMPFGITITGEQLKGTAVLEDKDPSNWRVKSETAPTGILTYGVKDSKFNFSFTGVAPLNSTAYSLITYPESFSVPAMTQNWPRKSIIVLGTGNSDGSGNVNISGSLDLGTILNMKVWLIKSTDVSGDQVGPNWNPSDYLFDTGLIDYYDSDL